MVVLVYCRLDTTEKKVSKYEGITIDTIRMKNRKKRDQKKKKRQPQWVEGQFQFTIWITGVAEKGWGIEKYLMN